MHFRCHERQRKKIKLKQFYKSSLKTSTDNLCGPSEEGLRKRSVEVQLRNVLDEGTQKQIKIFIFEEFDHGSD